MSFNLSKYRFNCPSDVLAFLGRDELGGAPPWLHLAEECMFEAKTTFLNGESKESRSWSAAAIGVFEKLSSGAKKSAQVLKFEISAHRERLRLLERFGLSGDIQELNSRIVISWLKNYILLYDITYLESENFCLTNLSIDDILSYRDLKEVLRVMGVALRIGVVNSNDLELLRFLDIKMKLP